METFVVRVFAPALPGEVPVAGVIEHVGTSWSTRFTSGDELLAAVQAWLDRHEAPRSGTSATAPTDGEELP